ncbi:MAG: tRNA (adenosine(37)-N6)-threonylcarbamoyltransferase complex dimerization subunit type 1 TsaB [Gammaproteobacteria bacterium]|nr:tRNA (adenosine(37)-N6)-threonylcarbamoyltransferase complex dimerization subunit type 1 TsaB [Gammaproteobacteria bacterium]
MRILALDASTEACSAALWLGGAVTARYAESGPGAAERVLSMVDELLAEAGLPLAALDAIAAGIGPGAFTGVRISVAVAQGLAFGAGLRVAPVSTLEALAFPAVHGGPVLACLDARMAEVYWACFQADPRRGLIPVGPAHVGPAASVVVPAGLRCRGVGRGFTAYPELAALPAVDVADAAAAALPHARDIASLGALRAAAGELIDPAELVPLYLRDKVALTEAERSR